MRAVLFSQTHPGATPNLDEFEGPYAVQQAHDMRAAIGDDFPEGLFAVRGDAEATEEYSVQMTARVCGISLDEARKAG